MHTFFFKSHHETKLIFQVNFVHWKLIGELDRVCYHVSVLAPVA